MSDKSKGADAKDTSVKPTQRPSKIDSFYHLRISRLTVDKLGVKLYDKASAVVAELIANKPTNNF